MPARRVVLIAIAPAAGALLAACTELVSLRQARRPMMPPSTETTTAPQLAVCPVDSTQAGDAVLVGVTGGTLSLGGTSVAIPPDAVLQPTAFQIVIPQSPFMKVEIHAVGLGTFLFQQPVSVTIDYSRCPAGAIPSGSTIQAVYVDSTDAVLQNMGGIADSTTHRVTFSTGHLSGYAVAY